MPLLRLYLPGAPGVPGLRLQGAHDAGLRHGEDRGPGARHLPRGTHRTHGPRHHPHPGSLRASHQRLLRRAHQPAHRHADDLQGPRLRPRLRGRHTQCRRHAQLPRLPSLRACLHDDVAGQRTGRAQGASRTGRPADQVARPSRRTPGRRQRLRCLLPLTDGRAPPVLLSPLLAAHLRLAEASQRAPRRQCRPRDGQPAAPVVRRPCPGARQARRGQGQVARHP